MPKLINNTTSNSLIESFQSNDMKFTFVRKDKDGNYLQINNWMKCREYFNEILMATWHPEEFSFTEVYGAKYNAKENPLERSETLFAIKFPSAKSRDTFLKNMPVIHKLEEKYQLDLTQVERGIEGDSMIVIVHGSKFWIQKCILFNVYTMIMKMMALDIGFKSFKELDQECTNRNLYREYPSELGYVGTLGTDTFTKIINNLDELVQVPTKYVDGTDYLREPYTVHSFSGIRYFAKNLQEVAPAHLTDPLRQMYYTFKSILAKKVKKTDVDLFGILVKE